MSSLMGATFVLPIQTNRSFIEKTFRVPHRKTFRVPRLSFRVLCLFAVGAYQEAFNVKRKTQNVKTPFSHSRIGCHQLSLALYAADFVSPHLFIQILPADSEYLGCARFVASGVVKDLADIHRLDLRK